MVQVRNVADRQLEDLDLRQLLVRRQRWQQLAQLRERHIERLHADALARRVRRPILLRGAPSPAALFARQPDQIAGVQMGGAQSEHAAPSMGGWRRCRRDGVLQVMVLVLVVVVVWLVLVAVGRGAGRRAAVRCVLAVGAAAAVVFAEAETEAEEGLVTEGGRRSVVVGHQVLHVVHHAGGVGVRSCLLVTCRCGCFGCDWW